MAMLGPSHHPRRKTQQQQQQPTRPLRAAPVTTQSTSRYFNTPNFINAVPNYHTHCKSDGPNALTVAAPPITASTSGRGVPTLMVTPVFRDSAAQTDDWSDSGFKRLQSNLELARHLCEGLVGGTSSEGDTVPQEGLDWRVFHEGIYAKLMEESWHIDALRKELTAKVQALDAALASTNANQARLRALTQENALLHQHVGAIGAENARLAVLLHDATRGYRDSRQQQHYCYYSSGEPEAPIWCLPIDGMIDG